MNRCKPRIEQPTHAPAIRRRRQIERGSLKKENGVVYGSEKEHDFHAAAEQVQRADDCRGRDPVPLEEGGAVLSDFKDFVSSGGPEPKDQGIQKTGFIRSLLRWAKGLLARCRFPRRKP